MRIGDVELMERTIRTGIKEVLHNINGNHNKAVLTINKGLMCINPKIRAYYNFSLDSLKYLVENTDEQEFETVVKGLDGHKQYSIYDSKELEDFKEFLKEDIEESEGEDKANSIKLLNSLNDDIIKVNDNLYIHCIGDLEPQHWI